MSLTLFGMQYAIFGNQPQTVVHPTFTHGDAWFVYSIQVTSALRSNHGHSEQQTKSACEPRLGRRQ